MHGRHIDPVQIAPVPHRQKANVSPNQQREEKPADEKQKMTHSDSKESHGGDFRTMALAEDHPAVVVVMG